jgi:4-alpha-glucanotransferase
MPNDEKILHTEAGHLWKKFGIKERHGIDIFLPSIHSAKSSGIGEFGDLFALIDWCKGVGLEIIQLLPINDSGNDTSPYNAVTSCALNPIFLSLHALPYLQEFPHLAETLSAFKPLLLTPRVRYHHVLSHKLDWLRSYFDAVSEKICKSEPFLNFAAKEKAWIEPYALFKVIKDRVHQNHWLTWPEELKNPSPQQYERLCHLFSKEMLFYIFLQFFSFQQLHAVKEHGLSKGVHIKGDIPILISPDSCDVWHHKPYFNLDFAAGAPPDFYVPEGQYWGFPLFHWDAMRADQFSWWKQRLRIASQFYDFYRIDHMIGFYRVWGIPHHAHPKEGKFFPENPERWIPQGEELLKMMLHSSEMMPIAEDLGVIPDEIRQSMRSLGICGTNVIPWEKLSIDKYPRLGMTSVSTHDSLTMTQWYATSEGKHLAHLKGWHYGPHLTLEHRKEILRDSHRSNTLFHINLLGEYLALYPELVWEKPEDERINIPGTLLPTNWTYRMRPSLEQIFSHEPLNASMREIIHCKKP